MRMLFAAGCLAALGPVTLACTAAAGEFKAGDLNIENPWSRATPGGAEVAGGYVTIRNTGTLPDHLVGGSLATAAKFELHQMSMQGGVMSMRAIDGLEIPAGGTVTLAPSAKHIMFTGLTRGLKKGESIDGTLVFDHAGTVAVRFTVEGLGAKGPAATTLPGHAMPGMDMD